MSAGKPQRKERGRAIIPDTTANQLHITVLCAHHCYLCVGLDRNTSTPVLL